MNRIKLATCLAIGAVIATLAAVGWVGGVLQDAAEERWTGR